MLLILVDIKAQEIKKNGQIINFKIIIKIRLYIFFFANILSFMFKLFFFIYTYHVFNIIHI